MPPPVGIPLLQWTRFHDFTYTLGESRPSHATRGSTTLGRNEYDLN